MEFVEKYGLTNQFANKLLLLPRGGTSFNYPIINRCPEKLLQNWKILCYKKLSDLKSCKHINADTTFELQ